MIAVVWRDVFGNIADVILLRLLLLVLGSLAVAIGSGILVTLVARAGRVPVASVYRVLGVFLIAVRTFLSSIILCCVSVLTHVNRLTAISLFVTCLATFVTFLWSISWDAVLGVHLHCITVAGSIMSSTAAATAVTFSTTRHFGNHCKCRP